MVHATLVAAIVVNADQQSGYTSRMAERHGAADEAASNPDLVAAVRDEIAAAGGRITFARYMDLALYHPRHGYYLGAAERPGRTGDFITSPELSPLFGHCLMRQAREVWDLLGRPTPFTVIEYGAGGGRLARDLLVAARAEAPDFAADLRYVLHEANPHRRAEAARRLADAGVAKRASLEAPGEEAGAAPVAGLILTNEFVDALPVHRVVCRDGAPLERYVAWDGGWFAEELGPPSTPRLAAALAAGGVRLAEGQSAEVNLAAGDWLAGAARRLSRGVILTIDYGYPTAELYDSIRQNGTFLCYYRHATADDPYARVGHQDMTAHVDFGALERAGAAAGLATLGLTTQAHFLTGLGLGELLVAGQTPDRALGDYLADRAAVLALIAPRGLGGFRVLAQARDLPPDTRLAGFITDLSL
ncbi:MAG TPA: SAM-dependent methyltransferase [Thermomicrobiales bacterium]|nr:SAM-dependent methyltransferase [Thermomicrobiales bacterium]